MYEKPAIVVYRYGFLLPFSETFIRAQGEGLRRFTPYYVGLRRRDRVPLPVERIIAVNQGGLTGKAQETLYKVWGVAPSMYRRVKKLNPVLIHAHFGPDGVKALPLARSLRVPLLVTFWGFDATMTDEYLRRSARFSYRAYVRH